MCTHLDKTGSTYYFRRPVPKDLVGCFTTATGKPRKEWKFSLGTKDREEAKRLLRSYVTKTDKLIDDARVVLKDAACPPIPPKSQAQLAKERALWEWEQDQEAFRSAEAAMHDFEIEELEPVMDAIAAGQVPDVSSAVLVRAAQLLVQHQKEIAVIDLEREANKRVGMVKGHDVAEPARKANSTLISAGSASVEATSLSHLFERYAQSGAANPKTVGRWRRRVAGLVDFLGHDDVARITRADLNRWVAGLVARPVAGKTIRDGYLPAVRAAINLAYDDELIPSNPAKGLTVRAPKLAQLRERELTDKEAETILAATMKPQPENLAAEHALARRWVPWLCAYTGARVGEITQLRACDVQCDGDTWLIHITPEAGSVKTSKARKVPLHPHLIEQGIVELAKPGDTSPLFYRNGAGNEVNPAYKVRAADIAKWVRSLGVTNVPQPNHGWRHRFKTKARLHGIPADVADAIQGHVPRNEGGKYGSMPMSVLLEAIKKLPRYPI